ncbi:hypothetical protein BZG36_04464 [Bifiguratus adelaidae]|uniref:Cytochrome b5 heme-binding domain-containing protein n=1 Tax=Bifiguratus adelaidae TaxID=1938954 RepID=A0A261XVQ2_9FUNG|nr:hypothetical protein BZG36_04464 [Bifiguratus adelaidae]
MTPPEARTLECTQTYITRQEIDARTKTGEILIIYSDKVYKLDKWIKYHPGGVLAIQHLNGKDATDEIHMMHPEDVYRRQVHRYYVGEYADDTDLSITQRYPPSALPTPPRTPVLDHSTRLEYLTSNCIRGTERKESLDAKKLRLSYEEFARRIEELGLDKCNYWNYGIELCRYTALFVSSLLFIFYGYQTWHYMFSAVLMAGFWHQVSFFAHDAGHNSITHVLKVDNAVGIIAANWLGGLSLGWWKKSHNVHHIITNDPEHDPDIQHLPFFAVSERFANNLYSTYYKRILPFDAAARRFVSVQHWTYYLILSFGRFNLYRLSFEFLANEENYRYFYFEVTGLVFFWCWLGYVLSHLPSWGMIWAWIMVSHILTVSLHVQITLSHFGMSTEVIEDEPFPAKMLRTTMDVDCPTWLDWYHGGLQFQAIHHLFPRVPRHNLRACVPLVRQFAKDNGLTYHSYDFAKGNGIVLGRLKEVADQIKLLGEGKVHGSLARAGKVKSQTPKVAKQEKKKKPTGRAKKRMVYNRRYVNVTTTFGGKRRMNPAPTGDKP